MTYLTVCRAGDVAPGILLPAGAEYYTLTICILTEPRDVTFSEELFCTQTILCDVPAADSGDLFPLSAGKRNTVLQHDI